MYRRNSSLRASGTALFCLVLSAACDTTSAPDLDTTKRGLTDGCVKFRERAYACGDSAIDVMIEVRAKHRPEFAEALRTEAGKKELREIGLAELEADGAGPLEEREAKCREIAERIPESAHPILRDMSGCLAAPSCDEFSACLRAPFAELVAFQAAARK